MIKNTCNICNNYFSAPQYLSKYNQNDLKKNIFWSTVILSYFTIIIPSFVAAIYGIAYSIGLITNKSKLSPIVKSVDDQGKKILFTDKPLFSPDLQIEVKKTIIDTQAEILEDNWGTITLKVNGEVKVFKSPHKDVVILPSEDKQSVEYWNWCWSKDGMHHHPGIRIKDIEHFVFSQDMLPDVIILSQGRGHGDQRDNEGPGVLEIEPDVVDYIKMKGVKEVFILKTVAAIEKYNEMRKEGKKRIAAFIHTTC